MPDATLQALISMEKIVSITWTETLLIEIGSLECTIFTRERAFSKMVIYLLAFNSTFQRNRHPNALQSHDTEHGQLMPNQS